MAESSGNYAAYHFYNAASQKGDANPTGVLLRNNKLYSDGGFWPFNNTERDILWNDKIGITCMEWFWYTDTNAGPGNQQKYLFEFKSRYDDRDPHPNDGNSNRNGVTVTFKQNPINGNPPGSLIINIHRVNGSSATAQNVSLGSMESLGLTTGHWYHSIIRYNFDNTRWEFLLGDMGRRYDGQVEGSTSDLSNITWNISYMNGTISSDWYYRYEFPVISSTAVENRGPLAIGWGYGGFPVDDNYSSNRGSFTKFSILTKSEGVPSTNKNQWLDHLWQGGIADLRFWYSSMDNVRTYEQLKTTRDTAPFYQAGENSDLIHCWRFNNTGDTATGQQDVGKYTGVFYERASYDQYVQHRAGWPYDISEPSAAGEVKLFTGTSVGVAEQVDFYGAAWAQDSEGNPVYREAPEYPLVRNGDGGIDTRVGTPVRAIVEDFYNQGDYYWLPGTGIVEFIENDDEGQEYYSLSLPDFDVQGYGALFSNIFLIDNNVYTEGFTDNGSPAIPYFSNRRAGPYIIVAGDTAGSFSLNFRGDD